jgi:peptidoglycan/xylan/chitin deacetylase (PgdA/CDA1 family)
MQVLLRSIAAIGSIALGSWIGLHPSATASAPPASGASQPAEKAPADPTETQHVETALAPGPVPWPHLNPEASIPKAWRLAEGPHRKPGDKRRLVALTFDDGPSPETTPRVLELLAKHGIHATFFVVGRYLDGDGDRAVLSRDVLRSIVDAGHLVGNHTHDHALLTTVTHTKVLEQIDRGAASIERVIGKRPILFRPPFGALDDFGEAAVRERGLDVVLWSAEAQDMERDDADSMYSELVRQLVYNEGGIVLLHDIKPSSVKILNKLLTYLTARRWDPARPQRVGYEIVDLPSYLREVETSPPEPGARDKLKKKALPRSRERMASSAPLDAS